MRYVHVHAERREENHFYPSICSQRDFFERVKSYWRIFSCVLPSQFANFILLRSKFCVGLTSRLSCLALPSVRYAWEAFDQGLLLCFVCLLFETSFGPSLPRYPYPIRYLLRNIPSASYSVI